MSSEETIITPDNPVTIVTPTASPHEGDNEGSSSSNPGPYATITEAGQVDLNDPKVKLARIMRIGEYAPQRYATSAPPLPEEYVFDRDQWAAMVAEARRVEKLVRGIPLSPEEAAAEGEHTKQVSAQRAAELAERKAEVAPVTFWDKVKVQAGHIASNVSYCASKLYAYAKDEVKRSTLEQAFIRFGGLGLMPKELEASGALLAGFYCRAVVDAGTAEGSTTGKTASGWLFVTEKLVIFDGSRTHLPNVTIEGDGHHRFSFQLVKIASFVGAQWKTSTIGTPAGEVPTFTCDSCQERGAEDVDGNEKKSNLKQDAVLVFDQTGCVHQFWDFNSYFENARDVLNVLNCAWRDAMLK